MKSTNQIVANAIASNIDYDADEAEYIKSVRAMIPQFKQLAAKSFQADKERRKAKENLRQAEKNFDVAFKAALDFRNNSGFSNRRVGRFKSQEWKQIEDEVNKIPLYIED